MTWKRDMRRRSIKKLMRLECYAYDRWKKHSHPFWYNLAASCNAAVKKHPHYRGVR